jgi:hypothetical protein
MNRPATLDGHLSVWRRAVVAAVATIGSVVGGGAVLGHAAAPTASASQQAPADRLATPAAAYLTIANAGNKRLDTDFDRLQGPDRVDLAAARADLRDIAATEHLFDQRLAALKLPPGPEAWAHTLIRVNETRAALTTRAAAGVSPAQLAGYRRPLAAANVPVESAATAIRVELGLPAPDTS